jgi:hypothetical protein
MSVLNFLTEVASDAVLSSSEPSSTETSFSTIQTRIGLHFADGVINHHFRFGSSTRGTILPRVMDERSDIDYMIVFKEKNAIPQTYLNRLKFFVVKYYSSSEIRQSSPTIVLELNHIKFDLVPATTNFFGNLYILNGSGEWILTNPNDFNTKLEKKNKTHKSLIKPTLRLFKFWNARSGYPFDSFEMEKWVCTLGFLMAANQKDYFFSVINNLRTNSAYSLKINKEITRAKNIVATAMRFEKAKNQVMAEAVLKKLFRFF